MRPLLLVLSFAVLVGLANGCSDQSAPPTPSSAGNSSTGAAATAGGSGGVSNGGSPSGTAARGGNAPSAAGAAGAGTAGAALVNGGGAGANSSAGSGGLGGSGAGGVAGSGGAALAYPERAATIEVLDRVHRQFANKWQDPARPIVTNTERPSNIWTRAVYYEGLLNLHAVAPHPDYRAYAVAWGEAHRWSLRGGANTSNADDQCAGQAYLELYALDGAMHPERIAAIRQSIDRMVDSRAADAWWWIDALQMAMPIFARLGAMYDDPAYFDKMHALYAHSKNTEGGGLYNKAEHLWWRDAAWKPPAATPGGKDVYWSRGNGWVFAALVRTLEYLPASAQHRAEYEQDFKNMAAALLPLQRSDGFWNVSLHDPNHFPGPEVSGTSLFVYGMAWGIRRGLLSEAVYGPVIIKAFKAMVEVAVHDDGFLGYVQSTGEDPSDGQPVTYDKRPDFEDYGVGCFLLGGSELLRLTPR